MDAERCRFSVFARFVNKAESGRDGEINLVGRDRELTANCAPNLDVDLRPVEGGFVRHFDVIDSAALQDAADNRFGLDTEILIIDELLAQLRRIVGGATADG